MNELNVNIHQSLLVNKTRKLEPVRALLPLLSVSCSSVPLDKDISRTLQWSLSYFLVRDFDPRKLKLKLNFWQLDMGFQANCASSTLRNVFKNIPWCCYFLALTFYLNDHMATESFLKYKYSRKISYRHLLFLNLCVEKPHDIVKLTYYQRGKTSWISVLLKKLPLRFAEVNLLLARWETKNIFQQQNFHNVSRAPRPRWQ